MVPFVLGPFLDMCDVYMDASIRMILLPQDVSLG